MNHTIKGIIIAAAITSMLVVGATTVPIMQNSFAHKRSYFEKASDPNTNTNTNTNSADSSSSSSATAENTNNITNSATASQSQEQDACALVVSCEGTTAVTVGPPSPPPVECTDPNYPTFVEGVGCQDSAPTCSPALAGSTGTKGPDASGTCTASFSSGSDANVATCRAAGGTFSISFSMCTYPATQTCPPPSGSTQTPTVVNGRCTIIQPGAT